MHSFVTNCFDNLSLYIFCCMPKLTNGDRTIGFGYRFSWKQDTFSAYPVGGIQVLLPAFEYFIRSTSARSIEENNTSLIFHEQDNVLDSTGHCSTIYMICTINKSCRVQWKCDAVDKRHKRQIVR